MVYYHNKEYIIKNIYCFDDDEFSFDAECSCLQNDSYGVDGSDFMSCNSRNDDCKYSGMIFDNWTFHGKGRSPEDCGCIIHFRFFDIGKTVFLKR